MSADQNKDQKELEQEREKLKDLGVKGTWNILTDLTKKKRED
ncbi:MAG: hypothetical protein ACFFC1_00460 [Promethearchaeota archaeon]